MRNNETGEIELVVGNRQILSGFFIVVLLFAVGVAMGYILGQNTPRTAKLASDASAPPPATAADARPQPVSSTPPPQTAQAAETAQPADSSPQPTTQPVRESAPAETAAVPPPAPAPVANPDATGTYWQVFALARNDADAVVRTLQNKGFPASTSPGTKGLTRVLVGPYPDRAALGKAKSDLESAGFSNLYTVPADKVQK